MEEKKNSTQERAGEFWLHIGPEGNEQRFDANPHFIKVLHVEVQDGCEYTRTFNRNATGESVPPPGKDWQALETDSGSFTIFWRIARPQ